MYPVEEFRDSLERIATILVRLSVRFHLTGGAATIAYSEPRLTQDLDLVIDRVQLLPFLNEFVSAISMASFTFDEATIRSAISRGKSFQLLDTKRILKIDLYPRELIAGELGRTVQIPMFSGGLFPVVALQDLILSKLIWISHGSGKSRTDLRWLWRKATSAEQLEVRRYAELNQLNELLDQVLAESDEIDI